MNLRKAVAASVAILATLFVGGMLAAPAFAWSSSLSTTVHQSGSSVYDTASLTLTNDGPSFGHITFVIYQGSSFTQGTQTCTLGSNSLKWTDSKNPITVTGSGTYTSSTVSTSGWASGSYFFYVNYGGGDYPQASECESFTIAPTTQGVPEFPFGMALLVAVALPALFLARRRFVGPAGASVS